MEKDSECARELLIWIQEAVKAEKLHDPVYIKNGKCNIDNVRSFNGFLKQKPYKPLPKDLRKIGGKHASMVHAGPNPTPQHLDNLSKIALRHKIDHLDVGKNYALGDPESKKESKSEPETSDGLKIQAQASSSISQARNSGTQDQAERKSQIIEMDFMLAEIDAIAEIQK